MSAKPDVVILGAGMAGFGAAHACHDAGVLPRMYDNRLAPGGHTSSFTFPDGFIFDDGPHISFTDDTRFQDLLAESVNGDFERIRANVNNYWNGYWIKHPAHTNLFGLPTDLVVKCISEFVALEKNIDETNVANYGEWLEKSYGPTFASTFPGEYTKKYHTTEASNLTTDWVGQRLYRGSLDQLLLGALQRETPELHYIDKFRYPTEGGFVTYLNKFLPMANQHYEHTATSLSPTEKTITFANGTTTGYEKLISTVPINKLIPMIKGCPKDVLDAAQKLAVSQAVIVNVGLDRNDISDAHWTYFYDEAFRFARLSFPHMLSPRTCPDGKGSIQAEVYFSEKYRPFTGTVDDQIELVIGDLRRCGLIRKDDNILHKSAWFASGQIIYDHDRAPSLKLVHGYLQDLGIAFAGRYGEWGYLWTDDSFKSGELAANQQLAAL